jgi:hypothetical protein
MNRNNRISIDTVGTVAKSAYLRSVRTGREIGGVGVFKDDSIRPLHFVENELIVGAENVELVDELVGRYGGEIVPVRSIPEYPAMLPRKRRCMPEQPAETLTIRFAQPPTEGDVLERLDASLSDDIVVHASSQMALTVAGLAGHTDFPSGAVGLNILGRSASMPLATITEGSLRGFSPDPAAWDVFKEPLRMVDAWQLVESYRAATTPAFTMLAVMDSGWWFDPDGHPIVPATESASDLGSSILQVNLADNPAGKQRPLAGRGVDAPWHANKVAGLAFGGVNNNVGRAGAGGTVAFPIALGTSYLLGEVMYGLRICAAWGIDIVNMSFGMTTSSAGEAAPTGWPFNGFPTSEWNKVCQFAVDNGVVMVVSAGNDHLRLPDDAVVRPATRTPGVITVGALDRDAATGSFTTAWADSNYGSSVAIWAPGARVPCIPDGDNLNGSAPSGTSGAAPIVAGTAAMMRAVAPNLSAADIRRIIIETSWTGEGRVSHGLDAYAAVLGALAHALPDWDEPNNSVATARPLLAIGPGKALAPSSDGLAISRADSDTDYWRFDLDEYSTVTVKVHWYQRIADLGIEIQDGTGAAVDDGRITEKRSSGSINASGVLPPGRYFVRVDARGLSAYRLLVSVKRHRLAPDRFEPNNSFNSATPLRFSASPFDVIGALYEHGPGTFDLTLHTSALPVGGFPPKVVWQVDDDYFRFTVPAADGKRKPHIALGSDLDITATLFDDRRIVLEEKTGRQITFDPPERTECYLRVSGDRETAYQLWISMFVDPRISLADFPTYEVLPEWWVDRELVRLKDPITHFGVEIAPSDNGPVAVGDRVVLEVVSGDAHMEVTLIDASGSTVRTGQWSGNQISVNTGELEPGNYVLRVAAAAGSESPAVRVLAPFEGR